MNIEKPDSIESGFIFCIYLKWLFKLDTGINQGSH